MASHFVCVPMVSDIEPELSSITYRSSGRSMAWYWSPPQVAPTPPSPCDPLAPDEPPVTVIIEVPPVPEPPLPTAVLPPLELPDVPPLPPFVDVSRPGCSFLLELHAITRASIAS